MAVSRSGESREVRRAEQMLAARTSILNAAARVFLRDGYQRSTMRGIAKEAGYTASSLYTYFASKEALFEALREEMKQRGTEIFQKPMPQGLSFPQKLEMVSIRIGELALEMKEALLLAVVVGIQLPDESLEARVQHSREFMRGMTVWFETHATPRELNGHNPEVAAYVFYGMIETMLYRALDRLSPLTNDSLQAAFRDAQNYTLAALSLPPKENT